MINEPKKPSLVAPLDPRRAAAARNDSGVLQTGAPSEAGFSATLQHAGLWDLVQLRCESRVRCVVRVTSGRRVGYLYFSEGQIVHAVTDGMQGERAVLDILGWTSGTWESCERPWPTAPTITISWQGLFLRAAQRQDEARRQEPSPAPGPARAKSPPSPDGPRAIAPQPTVRLAGVPAAATPAAPRREESGVSYRPEDFEHTVRMDARGTIVSGHGATEEHAELAAYCCRLGDLLGELLDVGKLRGLDAGLHGSGRAFIVRESNGDTIVLRPRPDVDPGKIRAQLKL